MSFLFPKRSDASSPSLPVVAMPGPKQWSWLEGTTGQRRGLPRTSHSQSNGYLPVALLLGVVCVAWVTIGIYLFYVDKSRFADDLTEWHAFKLDLLAQPQQNMDPSTDASIRRLTNITVPVTTTERPHVHHDSPRRPLGGSLGSEGMASRFFSQDQEKPAGGSTLVLPRVEHTGYPGASRERMHGTLGVPADGEALWVPGPKPDTTDMARALMTGGGFNIALSNSIPLDRRALDNRHQECQALHYNLTSLPEASVIIVFFNEPFSTLMRSVHSVLNLSPPSLLKEILLVDDGSTSDHIASSPGKPSLVERYAATLPKVRLLRNPTRTGIVGARMLGIENALANIFVILDSHIEVQPEWLEPLVQRIQENPRRMVMPAVDGISPKTFDYSGGGIGCTLGIIWDLMEHAFTPNKRHPARQTNNVTAFIESPTMAGGLFAAERNYFLQLGGYDPGMKYWGAENLELSFRLWQCGGALECSRCSRVYHIFREGGHGYPIPDPNAYTRNKLRTMAVWMDEFADLTWRVLGQPEIDIGDISERLALRNRLECKPFSFFLNTVWPESDVRNLTRDVPYMGRLRNVGTGLCITSLGRPDTLASLRRCDGVGQGKDMMYFVRSGRIMPVLNDEACLNRNSEFQWCRETGMDNARWRFSSKGQIVLEESEEGYSDYVERGLPIQSKGRKWCLAADPDSQRLSTVLCAGEEKSQGGLRGPRETDKEKQIWQWDKYEPPMVWTPPSKSSH